jgi:hypothetical protein
MSRYALTIFFGPARWTPGSSSQVGKSVGRFADVTKSGLAHAGAR